MSSGTVYTTVWAKYLRRKGPSSGHVKKFIITWVIASHAPSALMISSATYPRSTPMMTHRMEDSSD